MTENVNTTVSAAEGSLSPAGTQPEAASTGAAAATQSAEDNARYAAIRRRVEAESKAKYEAELEASRSFESEIKSMGYGSTQDAIAELKAAKAGISVSEQKAQDAKIASEVERHPAVIAARRQVAEAKFAADLAEIKKTFPDCAAESVWELGDVYQKLMRSGCDDPVAAYTAQRAADERASAGKKEAPPSTGAANAEGTHPEREFYTSDELDRLTSKDLDNPKILEKAMKSLRRL